MEAEITELATRGATALVGLMVTEAWSRVRPRFAALLGRDREEEVGQELEEIRIEVADDPEEGAAQASQWQRRLRLTLRNNPEAVAELRAILDEFDPNRPEQEAGSTYVYNTIKDGTHSGTTIQAGRIQNIHP
ncbi:hypothetical protein [Streptomyces sp. NRRL S-350]|uniref:hypothetical protein n=1 Tax=Streptomyces sp. NRRL S-350 TaxID=1463902 RepID=UPI0004BE9E66|nr:hypothetical protein [Streptomyces sp. NRRL S-350]